MYYAQPTHMFVYIMEKGAFCSTCSNIHISFKNIIVLGHFFKNLKYNSNVFPAQKNAKEQITDEEHVIKLNNSSK